MHQDSTQREKDAAVKKADKQRKQLKIEHNHGESLRGLVLQMLEQAE